MTKIAGSKTDTIRRLRSSFLRAEQANPEILGELSPAPTIVSGTSNDATLTKVYQPGTSLARIDITGGKTYIDTGNNGLIVGTNNVAPTVGNVESRALATSPATPQGENSFGPWFVKFWSDAPKLQLQVTPDASSNGAIRLIVNGQQVLKAGFPISTNVFQSFDFGSRKPRYYEIEMQYATTVRAIRVDSLSRIWRGKNKGDIRAAITGDSHTEGASGQPTTIWSGCSAVMARLLGINDMRIRSVGGTGYLAAGSRTIIRTQMDSWITDGVYDLVAFMGGYNDVALSGPSVVAEALACWQKARAAQPNALIVVGGIFGAATGPSAGTITLETSIKAQFDAWGDNFSVFIPISTADEPWEFGTGKTTATNGTGNSDLYVFSDGIHYVAAGHEYRGYHMAYALRDAVLALVA
jgi:hypothetical protein